MSDTSNFDILLVGFDKAHLDVIKPMLGPIRSKELTTAGEVDAFLENYQLGAGTSVIISTFTDGMTHLEVGQALSSYFQGLNLIFLTLDRTKFEIEILKKNGFTESLLLPMDSGILSSLIEDIKIKGKGGGSRKYKAVKLVDIQPGQELPFEVRTFLPFNNKYVVLTGSGQLSKKKVELLKQKNTNSVFIDIKQVEKFYEFAAEQLINSGKSSNEAVSETEKTERMQATVRQLFRSILDSSQNVGDFETGRDLSDQSKKIVEQYLKQKTGTNLSDKLKEITGEGGDSYSHAQVVSTIACLLSMVTEIGQPEDLAIAGLFHDIGAYGGRDDISILDLDKLGADEQQHYKQHPRRSLNLLKEKRVTITQTIAEIIEKHHERFDGKGFPSQLSANRIPPEAYLLAYADAFEYLTRPRPGQIVLQPADAHRIIMEKLGLSPEVLRKIENFLGSLS